MQANNSIIKNEHSNGLVYIENNRPRQEGLPSGDLDNIKHKTKKKKNNKIKLKKTKKTKKKKKKKNHKIEL